MLKIKDNIDLKELEKFGFTFNNANGKYEVSNNYPMLKKKSYITINCWDREIYVYSDTENNDIVQILYALIKADLVEKVEE